MHSLKAFPPLHPKIIAKCIVEISWDHNEETRQLPFQSVSEAMTRGKHEKLSLLACTKNPENNLSVEFMWILQPINHFSKWISYVEREIENEKWRKSSNSSLTFNVFARKITFRFSFFGWNANQFLYIDETILVKNCSRGGFDEREKLVRFSVKLKEKLSNPLRGKKLCQFSKP
jgi:hypothetical protein